MQSRLPTLRLDVLQRDARNAIGRNRRLLVIPRMLPARPDQPRPAPVERDIRNLDDDPPVRLVGIERRIPRDNQIGGVHLDRGGQKQSGDRDAQNNFCHPRFIEVRHHDSKLVLTKLFDIPNLPAENRSVHHTPN